jgi:8-amino-7-oxononanoate synthase
MAINAIGYSNTTYCGRQNEEALELSDYLLARGILVPAIRPPTVPKNTARLRISLSAAHTLDDVKLLIQHLHEAEQTLLT